MKSPLRRAPGCTVYGLAALFVVPASVEARPPVTPPPHFLSCAPLVCSTQSERFNERVCVAESDWIVEGEVLYVQAIRADGGVAIAVTHPRQDPVRHAAAASLTVEGDIWEGYTPLPYAVPVQLLSIALALHHGRTIVPLSRGDGGRLIRESVARDLPQA